LRKDILLTRVSLLLPQALCLFLSLSLVACLPAVDDGGGSGRQDGGATDGGGTDGGGTDGGGTDGGGGGVNCGNGALDPGEDCEAAMGVSSSCQDQGFSSGNLKCGSDCRYDTSACQSLASCGNGNLDASEICEGFELRGKTCKSQGFTAGELACSAQCSLDTRGCTLCGNNKVEAGELCDGAQVGAETCASQIGPGMVGTLSCSSSCQSYDSSNCFSALPRDEPCNPNDPVDYCDAETICTRTHPLDSNLGACMVPCNRAQLGQKGSCGAGELCLDTGNYEAQPGSSSCQSNSECSQSEGYRCLKDSQGVTVCARELTACGNEVAWSGDFSVFGKFPGPTCSLDTSSHDYCALPQGDPGAIVSCADVNGSGVSGVCLAYCDGEGGPDLACRTGYTCQLPANAAYVVPESSPTGSLVTCTVDADCSPPHICESFPQGKYCARPAKMCVAI